MRRAPLLLAAALLAGCTWLEAPPPATVEPTSGDPSSPSVAPPSLVPLPPDPSPAPEAPPFVTLPPVQPPTPEPPGEPPAEPEAPLVLWPSRPNDPPSDPPVAFALGPDAQSGSRYASARLTDEGFEVALVGVGDATVRAESLVVVTNVAPDARELRLRIPRLDDPRVVAASLLVGEDRVDLLVPSPEGAWTLAPGDSLALGAELTLGGVAEAGTLETRTLRLQVLRL